MLLLPKNYFSYYKLRLYENLLKTPLSPFYCSQFG